MTQNEMIGAHLKAGLRITPLEALREYGCLRLGARIWELKRGGMAIDKSIVEVVTSRGAVAHVAEYRLSK